MSHIPPLTLLASLLLASAAVPSEPGDRIESGFRNPPASAMAQTWWHWIDGNVSREGITADLEAMKRAGIHEATIFNVGQSYPEGPVDFLSPQWLELFQFAAAEAKRLGLELAFHNGAGWSSSGGPWITPKDSMQKVVTSEERVTGPRKFQGRLPQPPKNLDYYEDIAVLAFPTPADGARIDDLERKTLSGAGFPNGMQPGSAAVPENACVPLSRIVDLTGKMNADGTLTWDAPPGGWTILRIGHTTQGTENHPAVSAGRGLECDKLSRKAFDVHWAHAVRPVLDKLGPLVGQSLTGCLIDSYEVGCGNWTPGFREEFQRRRGYDPLPFLPTLAGYYVEAGEVSERFLWDFRRTIGDLMADNYYHYFYELCREHRMKSLVEPYGGPFEALEAGAGAGVPMGEFWVGNSSAYPNTAKLAASIAHLQGTPFVGAESFTAGGEHSRFLNHPASLKPLGDWAWTEGVNRFIFHTYAHQPWMNIAPGMTFHMYGTEISRLNTWWEQGRAWMAYIARAQFLLQQGRCAADVLLFTGEASPNEGIHRPLLKELGYDYDEIGTDHIDSLTVENGVIRTPAGGEYRVLVLPDTTWMTPKLARHIGKLAADGATILASAPEKSPSLSDYPRCDEEVARIAAESWKKGRVISDRSLEQALDDIGLPPDFEVAAHGSGIFFIHRIADGADIYFVSNQQSQGRDLECAFRVTGRQPELWDAVTGRIIPAPVWQEKDGRTVMPLALESHGSVFVVFRNPAEKPDPVARVDFDVETPAAPPLPDLRISSAAYGIFDLADVTDAVRSRVRNGRLKVRADNALASGDPVIGVVKELRVEYALDGKREIARASENDLLELPRGGSAGELEILRAAYGKFSSDGIPSNCGHVDVLAKIADDVAAGRLVIPVDGSLTGQAANAGDPDRELRIEYTIGGESRRETIPSGQDLRLALDAPGPRVAVENGEVFFVSPAPGSVTCTTASGATKTARIDSVPKPLEIEGPWTVTFPPNLGAPPEATFDGLISWSDSPDEGVRYFSGTATYRKRFTAPKELFAPNQSLELDLGGVSVIAEVILNGRNLGILWQPPFRVPLGDALKPGDNELEIRVTNLWPNRLIGDARYPDDVEWGDWTVKRWPDWLIHDLKRPSSQRIAFATWRHWGADSPLQVSGLLGPVQVRAYRHAKVN